MNILCVVLWGYKTRQGYRWGVFTKQKIVFNRFTHAMGFPTGWISFLRITSQCSLFFINNSRNYLALKFGFQYPSMHERKKIYLFIKLSCQRKNLYGISLVHTVNMFVHLFPTDWRHAEVSLNRFYSKDTLCTFYRNFWTAERCFSPRIN